MEIIRNYKSCPERAHNSVIALGNFDGVHLGHQAIIEEVKKTAQEKGLPSAILTFEPHPITVLRENITPLRLTPLRDKFEIVESMGIDYMFVVHFNHKLSQVKANDFISDILVDNIKVNHIVIGHDFIFGHNREGNSDLLKECSKQYGYEVSQLLPVETDGIIYSSTLIRKYIKNGELKKAADFLGHEFIISGRVIKGQQRGKDLQVPTANINLKNYIRPLYGVYSALVSIGGSDNLPKIWMPAAVNIGINPTFEDNGDILEAHILDFDEDIYGEKIRVKLIEHLRPEKSFSDINELKEAMSADIQNVRERMAKDV